LTHGHYDDTLIAMEENNTEVKILTRLNTFAPTIIRIVLAISFILHGLPKLTHTAGMAGFFGKIGLPFPYQTVIFIGLLEVVGGILLLVGFGTRIISPLLVFDMLGAVILAKSGTGKGYLGAEVEILLLAGALSVFLSGPGALAIQKGYKNNLVE
jgi:putative oxidoreductase